MADLWSARCDCGWSAQAPQAKLIQQIRDHAREAHGLAISRKEALDQARPVQPK